MGKIEAKVGLEHSTKKQNPQDNPHIESYKGESAKEGGPGGDRKRSISTAGKRPRSIRIQ